MNSDITSSGPLAMILTDPSTSLKRNPFNPLIFHELLQSLYHLDMVRY
jgi:hypothetical protein